MANSQRSQESPEKVLRRALRLATECMDLLDAHSADPEAAAYLALAQQQLRIRLGDQSNPSDLKLTDEDPTKIR